MISIFASFAARSLTAADCNFSVGPCTKTSAGRTVTFDIAPKPPKSMEELTFILTVTPCGSLPDTIVLDLGMPGMMMGRNRVVMKKTDRSTWKGTGIIVRCMSGRSLWQATILSEALNNTAFTFDVKD
ncbi:MAG: hypothetical protein HGA70_08165 [Chlorobiaceae bacterium]|nr:hypothetical protein [Chlorobiaceae bacterium]NTW10520.1 hypothetical protein [Chlorobiaceae bacterium]